MEISDVWAEEIVLEQPAKKRHVVIDKNRANILFLIESSPLLLHLRIIISYLVYVFYEIFIK